MIVKLGNLLVGQSKKIWPWAPYKHDVMIFYFINSLITSTWHAHISSFHTSNVIFGQFFSKVFLSIQPLIILLYICLTVSCPPSPPSLPPSGQPHPLWPHPWWPHPWQWPHPWRPSNCICSCPWCTVPLAHTTAGGCSWCTWSWHCSFCWDSTAPSCNQCNTWDACPSRRNPDDLSDWSICWDSHPSSRVNAVCRIDHKWGCHCHRKTSPIGICPWGCQSAPCPAWSSVFIISAIFESPAVAAEHADKRGE